MPPNRRASAPASDQITLGSMASDQVSELLRNLDLNTITGLEALNLLNELKKKVTL